MRKLQLNLRFLGLIAFTLIAQNIFCQEGKTTLQVDSKVEELLSTKKKMNTSLAINDGYKIQIFNGNGSDCEKERSLFKREFKDYDSTIVYSSPAYKVYVGPFKSRIHAEGALAKIKERYPNALLIKP